MSAIRSVYMREGSNARAVGEIAAAVSKIENDFRTTNRGEGRPARCEHDVEVH